MLSRLWISETVLVFWICTESEVWRSDFHSEFEGMTISFQFILFFLRSSLPFSLPLFKSCAPSQASSPERKPPGSCLEGINLAASTLGAGQWRDRGLTVQCTDCGSIPSVAQCAVLSYTAAQSQQLQGTQSIVFCQDERGSVQVFSKSYIQPHLYHFQRILHTSSFLHRLLQYTTLWSVKLTHVPLFPAFQILLFTVLYYSCFPAIKKMYHLNVIFQRISGRRSGSPCSTCHI